MKFSSKELKGSIKGIISGLVIIIGISSVSAGTYTGPSQAAPGGNADAPINVGSSLQVKNGSLGVNAFTALQNAYFAQNIGVGDTTNDGTLKLDIEGDIGATRYCDQNGNNCKSATDVLNAAIPTKAVMAFYDTSCPTGWIAANGLSGTPDLRGRNIIGVGQSITYGSINHTLGQQGGEELHLLVKAEMPSHAHSYSAAVQSQPYADGTHGTTDINAEVGGGHTTGAAGGNTPHNIMDPYTSLLYCMKS